jgi:hypothetical protein
LRRSAWWSWETRTGITVALGKSRWRPVIIWNIGGTGEQNNRLRRPVAPCVAAQGASQQNAGEIAARPVGACYQSKLDRTLATANMIGMVCVAALAADAETALAA